MKPTTIVSLAAMLMIVCSFGQLGRTLATENQEKDGNSQALFQEVSRIRDALKKHKEVSGAVAKDLKEIGISPQLQFGAQPTKSPDEASVLFYFPGNPIRDPSNDGDEWAMIGFTIPAHKNARVVVRRNWQVIWVGEYAFRMWMAGIDERKLWPSPDAPAKNK